MFRFSGTYKYLQSEVSKNSIKIERIRRVLNQNNNNLRYVTHKKRIIRASAGALYNYHDYLCSFRKIMGLLTLPGINR